MERVVTLTFLDPLFFFMFWPKYEWSVNEGLRACWRNGKISRICGKYLRWYPWISALNLYYVCGGFYWGFGHGLAPFRGPIPRPVYAAWVLSIIYGETVSISDMSDMTKLLCGFQAESMLILTWNAQRFCSEICVKTCHVNKVFGWVPTCIFKVYIFFYS